MGYGEAAHKDSVTKCRREIDSNNHTEHLIIGLLQLGAVNVDQDLFRTMTSISPIEVKPSMGVNIKGTYDQLLCKYVKKN